MVPGDDIPFAYDLSAEELVELFSRWGFKPVHARCVFSAIQRRGVRDFHAFSPGDLPQKLLNKLLSGQWLHVDPIVAQHAVNSEDLSTKYVFTLRDGQVIESVFMPFDRRNTLCLSTQVGCRMRCQFCATGRGGLIRPLRAGEMVSQVLRMRMAHPDPKGRTVRVNVVFMGMGEPLDNFDEVMKTFDVLTHPDGLVLSDRDVMVSTCGLIPGLKALAQRNHRPQLMVSLGGTTQDQRASLIPMGRKYPLDDLLTCLESYPLRKRESIMLSLVLLKGVNDTLDDARRLVSITSRFPAMVNLIPFNAHEGCPGWEEPEEEVLERFMQHLLDHGVFVTVRRSRGRDVRGACGQLADRLRFRPTRD